MSMTITILVPDGYLPEDIVEEVLRLIKEGYPSGHDPTWELVRDEI